MAASLPYPRRLQDRYRRHLLLSLLCGTRRTITGVLCTGGQQQDDWTADYQLYQRVCPDPLFATARGELLRQLPPEQELLLAMDDNRLELEQIVQRYVARWDIEVNIREAKRVIGAHEAMVRNDLAAECVPQSRVAGYSLLLLAAANCWGVEAIPTELAPPKWRRRLQPQRPSTNRLLNHLRYEVLLAGGFEGLPGEPQGDRATPHPASQRHQTPAGPQPPAVPCHRRVGKDQSPGGPYGPHYELRIARGVSRNCGREC